MENMVACGPILRQFPFPFFLFLLTTESLHNLRPIVGAGGARAVVMLHLPFSAATEDAISPSTTMIVRRRRLSRR